MADNYRVRLSQASELVALNQLEADATLYPWPLSSLQGSWTAGDLIFVLESDAVKMGYAVFRLAGVEAELLNIVVARGVQGLGWGKKLLMSCLNALEQETVEAIFLEVRASNQAAMALYQRLGFTAVGRRNQYYPAGDTVREDALLMRLGGSLANEAQEGLI